MPELGGRILESVCEDRVIKESEDGRQVTVHDKRKIQMHNKIKALEMLGRHLGMFSDKVDFNGSVIVLKPGAVNKPKDSGQ